MHYLGHIYFCFFFILKCTDVFEEDQTFYVNLAQCAILLCRLDEEIQNSKLVVPSQSENFFVLVKKIPNYQKGRQIFPFWNESIYL